MYHYAKLFCDFSNGFLTINISLCLGEMQIGILQPYFGGGGNKFWYVWGLQIN